MAPSQVVLFGRDFSHEGALVLEHQAVLVVVGLALAAVGFVRGRWAPAFTFVAAALYLVRWLPVAAIQKYGVATVVDTKIRLGANSALWWSSVVRDIVLPLAFLATVVCVIVATVRGLAFRDHPTE